MGRNRAPPPGPVTLDMVRRASLAYFVRCAFAELNPQTDLVWGAHLDLIVAHLEAVQRGEIKRLIINIPPRSLKSITASVAFPAWLLGVNPSEKIICASYSQPLAEELARQCRRVMQSAMYQQTFPATRLFGAMPAAHRLDTTLGGCRFATSVGGTITGFGGNIVVLDDLLKPDEAVSDVLREAANEWLNNSLRSRLNDQRTGAIVVIMQRLHTDDVVGHLLAQGEPWAVISLPAVAEGDELFEYESLAGRRRYTRRIGDLLDPVRLPHSVLDTLKAQLGTYNYAGQYQQAPVPMGGGMVKRTWLRFYEHRPERFEQIVQSWDTASKESELADYSVCTTWGRTRQSALYLLHVHREQMEFPKLKRCVVELREQFKADVVLIEDRSSGTQLIQELRAADCDYVKECEPLRDKVMRTQAQTPKFEGGFVWLPEQAAWLDDYISEITTFPRSRYNDQVDSTSQALEWMSGNPTLPAIARILRDAYEAKMGPPTASG